MRHKISPRIFQIINWIQLNDREEVENAMIQFIETPTIFNFADQSPQLLWCFGQLSNRSWEWVCSSIYLREFYILRFLYIFEGRPTQWPIGHHRTAQGADFPNELSFPDQILTCSKEFFQKVSRCTGEVLFRILWTQKFHRASRPSEGACSSDSLIHSAFSRLAHSSTLYFSW